MEKISRKLSYICQIAIKILIIYYKKRIDFFKIKIQFFICFKSINGKSSSTTLIQKKVRFTKVIYLKTALIKDVQRDMMY